VAVWPCSAGCTIRAERSNPCRTICTASIPVYVTRLSESGEPVAVALSGAMVSVPTIRRRRLGAALRRLREGTPSKLTVPSKVGLGERG
jgi:hypothetical protein